MWSWDDVIREIKDKREEKVQLRLNKYEIWDWDLGWFGIGMNWDPSYMNWHTPYIWIGTFLYWFWVSCVEEVDMNSFYNPNSSNDRGGLSNYKGGLLRIGG